MLKIKFPLCLALVRILKTAVVLCLTVVDVTVQSREADIPAAEAEDSTGAEIVGPEKGRRLPSSPHSAQQTIPELETPKLGGEGDGLCTHAPSHSHTHESTECC